MGRTFSADYEQRILSELDDALAPGERGAILRREGLYWSTVGRWRQRRDGAVRGWPQRRDAWSEGRRVGEGSSGAQAPERGVGGSLADGGGADADAGQGTAETGDAGASPVTIEATAETVAVSPTGAPATDEDSQVPAAAAAITWPPAHPAALMTDERHEVLTLLCSDRFMDLSPHQVFLALPDEGTYYCSVRSMYRLLEDHGSSGDRRRGGHQSPWHHAAPIVQAMRPNEAWSWYVTKLRGPTKGIVFYLYTVLDIFSR